MKTYFLPLLLALALFACTSKKKEERDQKIKEISKAKDDFYKAIDGQNIDYGLAKVLFDKYDSFVMEYPKDTLVPDFKVEQALLCSSYLGESKRAIDLYMSVVNDFPDCGKVPFALFAAADLFSTKLKDTDNAKKLYDRLIKEYPESKWAEDAKVLVKYLGMSDEEILQEILKKSGQENQTASEE